MTLPNDDNRRTINNTVRNDSSMMGWIVGAIAVIAVLGAVFYFAADSNNTTASNPGATTGTTSGSSTSTPAPARPATPSAPAAPSTPSK